MRKDRDTRAHLGRGLVAGAYLLATLCGIAALPSFAQADEASPRALTPASELWDGYSELLRLARKELGASHVIPLAALDFDALRPGDALVITHPEGELDEESLTRFLAEGGRVLLLDDFGTSAPLLRRFHIQREATTITNPKRFIAHNTALAVAQPVVRSVESGGWSRHPTTEGVREVITNHAVALVHPDLTALLEVETSEGPKAVATTGVIEGKGRLVAISDSSLFINLMLRYPGNRAFLGNLTRYLVERDEGARSGNLYLVSGAFAQKGSYGRLSAREEFTRKLRSLRGELERLRSEGIPARLAQILAALCALAVLGFELRQGKPEARVRLPSFALGGAPSAGESLDERIARLGQTEQRVSVIFAELGGALELALAERIRGAQPLTGPDVDAALATLPEATRRSGARVVKELRTWAEKPDGRRGRRLTEAELSRLVNEVTSLVQDLRQTDREARPTP